MLGFFSQSSKMNFSGKRSEAFSYIYNLIFKDDIDFF